MNNQTKEEVFADSVLNLRLAGVICPRDVTLCEIRGDSEYIKIIMQSPTDEKMFCVRNRWNVDDFCYWYKGIDIKKCLMLGSIHFDVNTGNLISIKKPMTKSEAFAWDGM